jgi:hypothetical protein
MSDFTNELSVNFTDNEIMRIINLYSRRIIDNGIDCYGKRDKRIMRKINKSLDKENFLNLYKQMDYGVGVFTQKKRTHILIGEQ